MSVNSSIRSWARRIKRDAVALWFAYRHPSTPLLAKAICVLVVAYALSPIDLIPDFIPVLGYLDDALLLPGMIWIAVKMVPPDVLRECRAKGDAWMEREGRKPRSYWGAALVVAIWVAISWLLWTYVIAPRP